MTSLADFALYLVPRVAAGLVAVLVVARGLNRAPARVRHALLASGLMAAFLMPLLAALVPVIEVPILPAAMPAQAPPDASAISSRQAAAGAPWLALLAAAWLLGSLLAVRGPLAALGRLYRFARGLGPAHPVVEQRFRRLRDDMGLAPARTRLVQSAHVTAPVSWGVRRATLAFPRGAEDWPVGRLDEALVHELAHVRRNDWLLTRLAELCCAVYWFLPPVWAAAARLRLEAERACDDIVLTRGGSRVDYAAHLLELARRERFRPSSLLTSHMLGAPESELGRRVRAILDGQDRRIHMGRKDIFTVAGLCTVLFLALAGVRATAAGTHHAPVPPAPRAESPSPVTAPVPEAAPVAPPGPVLSGSPRPAPPAALPALASGSGESPAPEAPHAEVSREPALLHRERDVIRRDREQIEARQAQLALELERVRREREQLHAETQRLHEASTALAREMERLGREQQEARGQMLEQQELLHNLQAELERQRQAQDAAREAD